MMATFNNRIFLTSIAGDRPEERSRDVQVVNISRSTNVYSERDTVIAETPRELKPVSEFGFGAFVSH